MPFNISVVLVVIINLLSIFISKPTYAQSTVRASVQHATCSGQTDGAINLHVNGTPPYKFEWSNGATTQNITTLTSGNYTVKVTDAKGARQKLDISVENISSLKIEKKTDKPSTGLSADGLIEVSVSGGMKPYTFSLSNYSNLKDILRVTQASNTFKDLKNGKYIIDVTDAKGCMATLSIHLK
jgi:hypothetical protein